jgi:hypothetical protein
MPLFSFTYSTAASTTPGASTVANLNWIGGKPTTVSVIPSAGSSGAFVIQYSLDDPMRVASTSITWSGLGSSLGAQATVFVCSASQPDGILTSFLSPVTAVRVNSTALSTAGTLTFKVAQGDGW